MERVLLVDDDATQIKLCRLRLHEAGFEVEMAASAHEALEKAKRRPPDAILSDVLMGEVDGFAFCRLVREEPTLAGVPLILLSAHYRDEPDQQLATRVGAVALVSRTPSFDAELRALQSCLRDRRHQKTEAPDVALYEQHLRTNANQLTKLLAQATQAEERYRTLFQNAHDAITVLTRDGVIVEVNERWRDILGIAPESMIGRHIRDFAPHGHEASNDARYESSIAAGSGRAQAVPIKRADGKTIYMEFSLAVVEVQGQELVLSIGHNVTSSVEATRALAAAEEKYRSLVERFPDVVWTCTADGTITFMTANCERIMGYTAEQMCAEDMDTRLSRIHPDDRAIVSASFRRFGEDGTSFDVEYRRRHPDGRWIWLRNRSAASYRRAGVQYIEGVCSDITERKRLEESLRQAQKMEAIGQLTGGIAHDFNNLLAAILANSHFLIEDLAEHDPRRTDAEDIRAAAERAAALTRQLLAFSHRQLLEPTVVDLNSAILGVERMLRRVIGEDIDFSVLPGEHLAAVRVDVGQLEQVVMNMVVNARDAMPNGGSLTIQTSNVDLDATHSAQEVGAPPGRYVMLSISDTGVGMDSATRQRIFEPFFTTKALGKGTGLGLATCYGIVKQSGGHIAVQSELGQGTVFRIYLPQVNAQPMMVSKPTTRMELEGSETILLVEDDARVRHAVSRVLESRGYRVLIAQNGLEAMELAQRYRGPIDLVLSDLILPGASGPEVVREVQAHTGSARALFMSGHTDHAVLRDGALQQAVNFIQKPFAPDALAKKVREVLAPTGVHSAAPI
jgi:two-component system, cell cycle sensor histidine kinase and response regulator CckA